MQEPNDHLYAINLEKTYIEKKRTLKFLSTGMQTCLILHLHH